MTPARPRVTWWPTWGSSASRLNRPPQIKPGLNNRPRPKHDKTMNREELKQILVEAWRVLDRAHRNKKVERLRRLWVEVSKDPPPELEDWELAMFLDKLQQMNLDEFSVNLDDVMSLLGRVTGEGLGEAWALLRRASRR